MSGALTEILFNESEGVRMECKCEIIKYYLHGHHEQIKQCPLCKAAPALLAACERALSYIADTDQPYCGIDKNCTCVMCELEAATKLVNAETTQNKSSQDSSG